MMPSNFLRPIGFAVLLACSLSSQVVARGDERPNILFIFTDDHAAHAMSCYGSVINQTPGLDRIAAEGMRFDNCLCTNALCGPSRATVLTGKYSHLNGFRMNGDKFDGTQQTFPKLLQKAGYSTAVIGKWHLGEHMPPLGFDYSHVLIGQGPYYNPTMLLDENGDGQQTRVKHTGYTTELITDFSLKWLSEGRDTSKPFLLMCQHKAPHRNWQPGPEQLSMYDEATIPEPADLFDDYATRGTAAKTQDMTVERTLTDKDLKLTEPRGFTPEQLSAWQAAYGERNRRFREMKLTGDELVRWKYQRYIKDYLRCVAAVDDGVGKLLDYLETAGLAEDTLVVYSSDQGFFLGDHGWFDKRFMYEESYRMPLVARWPGRVEAGSVSDALVSNVDFAATFLEAAGVEAEEELQGASLVPILNGQTPASWRSSHYYQYYEFRENRPTAHSVRRHRGVRTARHKLIHFYNLGEWELYDLDQDPDELRNVYGDPAYSAVQAELHAELERLAEELRVPDDSGSVGREPAYRRRAG
ncbi:MAG: sulfatase [Planctomycetota bacterium]